MKASLFYLPTIGSRAEIVWAPESFLDAQAIRSGIDMPLWRPPAHWGAFYRLSSAKAEAAGLVFRPPHAAQLSSEVSAMC